MKIFSQSRGWPLLFLAFFLHGTSGAERTLTEYSPFLPPPARNNPKPEKKTQEENRITERLEFRGFFEMGGDWGFSIYDKSKRSSYWLNLQEAARNENFRITDFDMPNKRVHLEWGEDRAFLDLHVANPTRGTLRARGGSLAASDLFDQPATPPSMDPPSAPPPPPASRPPPGPPPEIPQAVLAKYEQMLAEEEDHPTGAILGGRSPSGSPGSPPSISISGLPPARSPGHPPGESGGTDTGGTGSETGTTPGVGTGIEIPDLPGGVPGAPPGSPPRMTIPEIPDFPED